MHEPWWRVLFHANDEMWMQRHARAGRLPWLMSSISVEPTAKTMSRPSFGPVSGVVRSS